MITLGSIAVAFIGLVLLALIGRDAWLRTLEARRRVLSENDATAIRAIDDRQARIEVAQQAIHDRVTSLERQRPGPRRA